MIQTYQIQELRDSIILYSDYLGTLAFRDNTESVDQLSRKMAEVCICELPEYFSGFNVNQSQIILVATTLRNSVNGLIYELTRNIWNAKEKDPDALMKLKYCRELLATLDREIAKMYGRLQTDPTEEDEKSLKELNAFIRGDYDGIMEFDEFMSTIILTDLSRDDSVRRLRFLVENCNDDELRVQMDFLKSKIIIEKRVIATAKFNEDEYLKTFETLRDWNCDIRMVDNRPTYKFNEGGLKMIVSLYDKIEPFEEEILDLLNSFTHGVVELDKDGTVDYDVSLFDAMAFVIHHYYDKCSAIRDRICQDESQPSTGVEAMVGGSSEFDYVHMKSFTPTIEFSIPELYSFLIKKGVIRNIDIDLFNDCISHACMNELWVESGRLRKRNQMRCVIRHLKDHYEPEWINVVAKNLGTEKKKIINPNRETLGNFENDLREII